MSASGPARFPWLRYCLVLLVILLIALFPVISVIISRSIASMNGCNLNEGRVNVCMVGGSDMGDMLYSMFVMGWFGLLTLPLGFGAVIVWIVIVTTHRIAWGRRQKGIQP